MSHLSAALDAAASGVCVLPPRQDGSKAPDVHTWTQYQRRRPTEAELRHWYGDGTRTGVGYVCGAISGGLELLDFDDGGSAWHAFHDLVESHGLGSLWDRITSGYLERTPSGGYHVLFRSSASGPATKLAQRAKHSNEHLHDHDHWQVLIETKGEGGYAVVAPSKGAVHPTGGCYELLSGGVCSIASITGEEREALLAVARMLDEKPRPMYRPESSARSIASDSDKPGDHYNAQTTWEDLLPAYGWAVHHCDGPIVYWTRPGKDRGVSATTNYQGNGLLWVFTSSTKLDPDRSYDRFGFFTVMEHDGNFRAAARALSQEPSQDEAKPRGKSQASQLVDMAKDLEPELFHDLDSEPYITLNLNGHFETHRLRSRAVRDWLAARYFTEHNAAPGAQALHDALNALAGIARFQGDCRAVFVRRAGHDGCIYLDLGNDAWEVVEITVGGWCVIPAADAPVRFRRPKGMISLPIPTRGGMIDTLREFVNIKSDDDFKLVGAWLLGTLRPTGPYPILVFSGEQGTAKSTTAGLLRAVVDPNTVPLRGEPRDEIDLLIAANNGLIVALDNLSRLPERLSDAICRLATGGGISKRELYSDAEETLLVAQRPVLITGIEVVVTRGDAVDRSMILELEQITADRRRTETEINSAFQSAHPALLGSLLDAASVALRNESTTRLDHAPRLADFATWVEAGSGAFGWERGEFLDAYTENRAGSDELVVEALPVGPVLQSFMLQRVAWQGTPTELLSTLTEFGGEATRDRGWPKKAHTLSGQLKRLAPSLRRLGIAIEMGRDGGGKRRWISVSNLNQNDRGAKASLSSQRHESYGVANGTVTQHSPEATQDQQEASQCAEKKLGPNPVSGNGCDVRDARDAASAPYTASEDSIGSSRPSDEIAPWE